MIKILKQAAQTCMIVLLAWSLGGHTAQANIDIGQLQGVLNGLVAHQSANESYKTQYADRSRAQEMIDPQSGSLMLRHLDLALPGKDGLDLNIARIYKSAESEVGNKKVDVTSSSSTTTFTTTQFVTPVIGYDMELDIYFGVTLGPFNDATTALIAGLSIVENGNSQRFIYIDFSVQQHTTIYYHTTYTVTTRTAAEPNTYSRARYDLGHGWSLAFPSLQIENENGQSYYYFHDGTGASYRVRFTGDNGDIEKYPRTDVSFVRDAATYSNGQVNSSFVFTGAEQTKTYFGADGRLLGVVDKLGNEIKFTHTNRTINSVSLPYISGIIDTIGRVVTFTYENTITDPNDPAELIDIVVTHPSEPEKDISLTYTKGKQLIEQVINNVVVSSRYEPYLAGVTDPGGLTTYYDYHFNLEKFDFQDKSLASSAVAAIYLLKSVQYPHSMTFYDYAAANRNLGPEGAYEAFRVTDRYDKDIRYDYNEPDPGQRFYLTGPSNEVAYTYFGELTGYPDHVSLEATPESYRFGSTVTRELDAFSVMYTYNGKQQQLTQKAEAANGEHSVMTNLTFDENFTDRPTKQEFKELSPSEQELNKLYIGYEYYDWGGLQSQTLPLTAAQYDQDKDDYTVSYEYDPVFHKLSNKQWKRAANVTLTEQYGYDSLGRLSYVVNPNGERIDYTYAQVPLIGRTVEALYQLEGNDVSRTVTTYGVTANEAFPTAVTTYYTDSNQQPTSSTTEASYDLLYGLATERVDARQQATTYEYDAYGRLLKTNYSAYTNGHSETFNTIQHTEYIDQIAAGPEFGQDHHQMMVSQVYSYTTTVKDGDPTVSHDNMVTQFIDGYGGILRQTLYDGVNQQTIVQQQYEYDALKRPVHVEDAQQNGYAFVYDDWGNLVEVVDPFGNLQRNEYERATRTTVSYFVAQADVSAFRTTPQAIHQQNVLEQEADQWGRIIKRSTYPAWPSQTSAYEETYSYDWTGNMVSYTNPRGFSTQYRYDLLDRLDRITNPLLERTDYTYSRLGQITSITQTSSDGTQVHTLREGSYDERGLMTVKTHGSPQDYTYSHDEAGLLAANTDGNQDVFALAYDELNRLETHAGGNREYRSYYSYRPYGPYLIQDWSNTSLTGSVLQDFDAFGNVSYRQIVNDSQATISQFRHDTLGRISLISHPNNYYSRYTYDKTRIQRVQTNGQSLPSNSDSEYAAYTFNPIGTLQKITYPKLSDNTYLTAEFAYDATNRLIAVNNKKGSQVLSSYTYTYDANGNILTQTNDSGTTTYTYDPLDRLSSVQYPSNEIVQYTYDARGNRKTETTGVPSHLRFEDVDYTWNVWGQLAEADVDGETTTFQYEPQGLRIKKSNTNNTVRYTYDNKGRVIAEANAAFTVQANYVWGPDRLLQKRDASTDELYYYLHNGHGDVVQIVDSSGQVVNAYAYDEWGNLNEQQEMIANPFKYAGEIYDDETGLYYLRARYYDPGAGRFVSRDSYEGQISNPLSLNLYTYVHNNPLIYIDPTGKWCTSKDGLWSHPGLSGCSSPDSFEESNNNIKSRAIIQNGVITGYWTNPTYKFDITDNILSNEQYQQQQKAKQAQQLEAINNVVGILDHLSGASTARAIFSDDPIESWGALLSLVGPGGMGAKKSDEIFALLKKSKRVENRLESVMEDGTKIIFRRDLGTNAHPIGGRYLTPVEHYNIEFHSPNRSGGYTKTHNFHIIMDQNGRVVENYYK